MGFLLALALVAELPADDPHPRPVSPSTERVLDSLFKSLSVLSVELVPIHQRLVSMRRQLSMLSALEKPPKAEVKALVEELRKIDSKRVDGKFLGPGGSSVPTGQAILSGLLEECFEIAQDIRALHDDDVPPPLKPVRSLVGRALGLSDETIALTFTLLGRPDLRPAERAPGQARAPAADASVDAARD